MQQHQKAMNATFIYSYRLYINKSNIIYILHPIQAEIRLREDIRKKKTSWSITSAPILTITIDYRFLSYIIVVECCSHRAAEPAVCNLYNMSYTFFIRFSVIPMMRDEWQKKILRTEVRPCVCCPTDAYFVICIKTGSRSIEISYVAYMYIYTQSNAFAFYYLDQLPLHIFRLRARSRDKRVFPEC